MAPKFQVTFDCSDPQKLATFWATALGYKLEDPPKGFSTWEEWLATNKVPKEQWESRAAIVDPRGISPRFWFQKVSEPKMAKNRLHLDLRTDPVDGDGPSSPETRTLRAKMRAAQLVEAGATILYEMSEFGSTWITLSDPEGNEFCIG